MQGTAEDFESLKQSETPQSKPDSNLLLASLKIWRLNEYEWYAAFSFEEAVMLAMMDSGCTREETVDESYSGEWTNLDMQIIEEDGTTTTFRDELAKMTEPGFFVALE